MKLKKILAAVAAAAVAVSAMAINTFALSAKDYVKDNGSGLNTCFIQADKATDPSWVNDSGVAITEVYGAKFYVTGEGDWFGGKVCLNSNSTGWKELDEWSNGEDKPISLKDGTITYLSDSPIFVDSDKYAQICLMVYPGSVATVTNVEVLGKDGVVISTDDAPAETEAETTEAETTEAETTEAAPEEDAAPAEDEAEAEDEDIEVDVEPEEEEEDEPEAEPVEEETEAAPAETEAPAPVADAVTTPVKTGNAAVASVAAVMAVAGVAVIASKKRK